MRLSSKQQKIQDATDRVRLAFWYPLLKRLLWMVREIESDMVQIQVGLRDTATASRFLTNVGTLRWTHHYEHSFYRQYTETLFVAGASRALLLMLRPAKAIEAINAFAHGDDTDLDFDLKLTPKSAAAIFAIRRTAHCFVASGRTLNAVMASAQAGSFPDLIYALRIDPSILLSRTAQEHIARAATRLDPDFFPAVGNALVNPVLPSDSFDLDCCLLFLIYAGRFGQLSRKATCELFIDRLGLYSGDPESLWKKAQRIRANNGTKKRGDLSSKRGKSEQ